MMLKLYTFNEFDISNCNFFSAAEESKADRDDHMLWATLD